MSCLSHRSSQNLTSRASCRGIGRPPTGGGHPQGHRDPRLRRHQRPRPEPGRDRHAAVARVRRRSRAGGAAAHALHASHLARRRMADHRPGHGRRSIWTSAWFDVAEFRRVATNPTADADELTAAVDLHRGELLSGFAVRDSPDFETWQRIAGDGLRRELAGGARPVGRRAGRHTAASTRRSRRAEQRLTLDTLHEPAHRRLIELYARSGRRADALAQYRECVRALDRELGVRPLTETTELYNAVNEGRSPEPSRPAGSPTAPSQPLVGRDRSWRELTAAYGEVGSDGGVAVIEGESGIGKTRLAEEFLRTNAGGRRAGDHRSRAPWREAAWPTACSPSSCAAAIETATGSGALPDHCRAEAARLLPELGSPPTTGLAEPGARQRFLDAAGQTAGAGGQRPHRGDRVRGRPPRLRSRVDRRSHLHRTPAGAVAGCCCSPHTARTSPTPSDPARGLPISVTG